jgi:hypothetical protein
MPPTDGSRRIIEYDGGRIEIIREGDEHGEGLVRTCEFQVPKWLGTGGKARSWEVVTEVRPDEYSRYEAVGKPLWSRAEGWHELRHVQPDPARAVRGARPLVHLAAQRRDVRVDPRDARTPGAAARGVRLRPSWRRA